MTPLDRNFVLNLAQRDTDISYYICHIYNIPVQINAKIIVELGAGQSTFALTAAAIKTDGEFYSIDVGKDARERLYYEGSGALLDNEPKYHFILGDDMEIVKTWDKPIDFLLHDTTHIYDHTKAEISAWFPLVRQGGIIFAHDTNHESGDGMGCRKAYDEFMASEEGKKYRIIHLLDPKIIGASLIIKL